MRVFTYQGQPVTIYKAEYTNKSTALQLKDLDGFPHIRVSVYDPKGSLKEGEIAVNTLHQPMLIPFLIENNIIQDTPIGIIEIHTLYYPIMKINPSREWTGYTEITEDELDSLIFKCA